MPRSTGNAQPMRDCVLNGEYLQVDLGSQQSIGTVRIVVGSGDGDKIKKYHLEYAPAGQDVDNPDVWKKVAGSDYVGADSGKDIYSACLFGIEAQYLRLVCDDDEPLRNDAGEDCGIGRKKWIKFSEISVYPYVLPSAEGFHLVTYKGYDGGILGQKLVADGDKASASLISLKDDLFFDGWYTDEILSKKYDFNETVTGDITLYAGRREAEKYTAAEIFYKEATEFDENGKPKNGWSVAGGYSLESLTDGNDNSCLAFVPYEGSDMAEERNHSKVGDELGLDLGTVKKVGIIRVLVGSNDSEDKWERYHLEYSKDGTNWERPADAVCTDGLSRGIDTFLYDLNGIEAQYIKLVNDRDRAKWINFSEFTIYSSAIEYTVTFDTKDGTPAPEARTVKSGRKIKEPEPPEKAGYVFGGWYKNEGLTELFDFAEDTITEDITLHAKWNPLYTVVFHKNMNSNPEVTAETQVKENEAIDADDVPTWEQEMSNLKFAGWYTSSECASADKFEITDNITSAMVTEGVLDLYAKWTAQVTFDLNYEPAETGNIPQPQMIDYNKKAAKPTPDPAREGFAFKYWYQGEDDSREFKFEETPITSNITLKAKWTETRKIVFHKNDDTQTTEEKTAEVGSQASGLERPKWTSDVLDLAGWYTDAACTDGNEYTFSGTVASGTVALDLYAKWTADVEFLKNDGTTGEEAVYDTVTVKYNGNAAAPDTNPQREGYTFAGWYKVANPSAGDVQFNFETEKITAHTKLYANWTIRTYTVTFDAQNGENVVTQTNVPYGTLLEKPQDPQNGSKHFLGWFLQDETKAYDFENTPVRGDITLYAHWSDKEVFTVTFDKQAEDAVLSPSSSIVESGGKVMQPSITREHWKLKGWYRDKILTEGSQKFDFENTSVEESFTLYAHWERITYTVTFLTGVTETIPAQTVNSGEYAQLPTQELQREGYKFAGWYLEDATEAYKFTGTPILDNITLTAKWNKMIEVTFHKNDGLSTDVTQKAEAEAGRQIPDNAFPAWAKDTDSHKFAGWYTDAEGTAEFDVTQALTEEKGNLDLYAKWLLKEFTVTFDADGGMPVPDVQTVQYGNYAEEPAENPEKENYEFAGWYLGDATEAYKFAETVVTASITLTAKWILKPIVDPTKCSVTFDTDGGTPVPDVQIVDKDGFAAAPTTNPVKENYEFAGWYLGEAEEAYNFAETAVIENITLKAKWILKKYDTVVSVLPEWSIYQGEVTDLTDDDVATSIEYKVRNTEEANADGIKDTTLRGDYLQLDLGSVKQIGKVRARVGKTESGNKWEKYHLEYSKDALNWTKLDVQTGAAAGIDIYEENLRGVKAQYVRLVNDEDKKCWVCFTDFVVYPYEGPSQYTVTFDFNDDSKEPKEIKVDAGDYIEIPDEPQKEGYTFAGWYDEDLENMYNFNTPVTGDVILYAKWAESSEGLTKYTVTFDADGGTPEPEVQKVQSGEKAEKPEDPAKAGYTFGGWYTEEGTTAYDFDTLVTADVALKAKWIPAELEKPFTVTFDADGGKPVPKTQKVKNGKKAVKPANPTKAGYTFGGWYTEEGTTAYDFDTPVTADLALKAKWIPEGGVTEYTVTFDTDDGEPVPDVQKVESGKTAERPADPQKAGYIFAGWYQDEALTELYDFESEVIADIILYAKWTKKEETNPSVLNFTITFKSNGGTTVKSQKIKPNGKVSAALAVTKRNGYTFEGWYIDASLKTKFNFNTLVIKDMTLYAKWKKNTPVVQQKKVSAITFEEANLKIAQGKKVKLTETVTILPEDAANKKLVWTSSNPKVATVVDGVVSIKKRTAGKTVTITATAADGSKKSASVKIKVMKNAVTKITVKASKSAKAGKTMKLKVKIKTNGKKVNKKLKWISSNPQYAAVNSKGKVKFYKAGKGKKVKITVMTTDGSNKKKTVSIKIK